MIAFIDQYRSAFGVKPICSVLPIAPSTYHARMCQRVAPELTSMRVKRDAMLRPEIKRFSMKISVFTARARSGGCRRGFAKGRQRLMKTIEFLHALKNARVRSSGFPGLTRQRRRLRKSAKIQCFAAHGK
jgi:hypothetical protein